MDKFEEWIDRYPFWDNIYWGIFHRVPSSINDFFSGVKYFYQRGKRGYSEQDSWDLKYHLSRVISESIGEMASGTCGYPCDMTRKGWLKGLRQVSKAFKDCYELEGNICEYGHAKYKRLYKKNQKDLDRAFDFLREHWGSLWD